MKQNLFSLLAFSFPSSSQTYKYIFAFNCHINITFHVQQETDKCMCPSHADLGNQTIILYYYDYYNITDNKRYRRYQSQA